MESPQHRTELRPFHVWAAWSPAKSPSWILPVSMGWEWLMEQTAHSLISRRAGCCCKAGSWDKSRCESLNGPHLTRSSLKEQEWMRVTKRRVSHFTAQVPFAEPWHGREQECSHSTSPAVQGSVNPQCVTSAVSNLRKELSLLGLSVYEIQTILPAEHRQSLWRASLLSPP